MLNEARCKGTVECKPADCTRDITMAADDSAVAYDSRTYACPNGQEDRVACASGSAPPGFAEDVGCAVAVDCDGSVDCCPELIEKRIVFPSRNVGSTDRSTRSALESGNAHAGCGAPVLFSESGDL